MRQSRKLDHLNYAASLPDGPLVNGFTDFTLVHNCLPELSAEEITLSTTLMNIPLSHPIIINAVTGGACEVTEMNTRLGELAKLTNAAMAVGSQYAGLENLEFQESYKVVRKVNPNGTILANLGAYVTPDEALQAVDMIEAQGIQIHLNPAQEVIMSEGDRSFSGYLKNIEDIVKRVGVPVIVKEVGCGIAMEQAKQLLSTGIRAIDIGGAGGTNFMAIEAARNKSVLSQEELSWGIPTAISAVEMATVLPSAIDLIISGGIRTPLDVVKALCLGGKAAGMATPFIKILNDNTVEDCATWLQHFLQEIKKYMLLLGTSRVCDLNHVPMVITGFSREWLSARGIDTKKYATRKSTVD